MGVYQLVDFMFWEHEAVGSNPTTHTKKTMVRVFQEKN